MWGRGERSGPGQTPGAGAVPCALGRGPGLAAPEAVAEVAAGLGIAHAALLEAVVDQRIKDRLKDTPRRRSSGACSARRSSSSTRSRSGRRSPAAGRGMAHPRRCDGPGSGSLTAARGSASLASQSTRPPAPEAEGARGERLLQDEPMLRFSGAAVATARFLEAMDQVGASTLRTSSCPDLAYFIPCPGRTWRYPLLSWKHLGGGRRLIRIGLREVPVSACSHECHRQRR